MTDFDYDVMMKKRLANQARHRKGTKGRKGCKLPSDYLTEKEKKAMNGEVKTVKLGVPMKWDEFKNLSKNLKLEYLNDLKGKYHPSIRQYAELFDAPKTTVQACFHKLGYKTGGGFGNGSASRADEKLWAEFIGKTDIPETPVEEEKKTDPICVENSKTEIDGIRSEKSLRQLIKRNLRYIESKEIYPKVNIIFKILEDCYTSGLKYDVTDMRTAVLQFAANSLNHANECVKLVSKMKFKSQDTSSEDRHVIFDHDEDIPETPVAEETKTNPLSEKEAVAVNNALLVIGAALDEKLDQLDGLSEEISNISKKLDEMDQKPRRLTPSYANYCTGREENDTIPDSLNVSFRGVTFEEVYEKLKPLLGDKHGYFRIEFNERYLSPTYILKRDEEQ